MLRELAGGAVTTVIIGGTAFTMSQADVANNFAANTGTSNEQAQEYVKNVKDSDLESFSKIGTEFVNDGNQIVAQNIDCANYTYKWESASLSCVTGRDQLQKIASDEIFLGRCFQALDTDLSKTVKAKINECIALIDVVNADMNMPVATAVLGASSVAETQKANSYNKSVLQAAANK